MLLKLSKYIFVNTYWKKNDFDTNGKKNERLKNGEGQGIWLILDNNLWHCKPPYI